MKRLTYISRFSLNLTAADIEKIGKISQQNNQARNITGVLLCLDGMFFQILEGEAEDIDQIYQRILDDPRHTDILCLKSELNVTERLFPEWSMQIIDLEHNTDLIIQPIKTLLETITESHGILEKYTQNTIFKLIQQGINPLELRPKKIEKIIMFSDIVSFSAFADKLPVEHVVYLVDHYLTSCAKIISEAGGEVTKFIGDCVMAYFDADQADAAIQAGLDILLDVAMLRNYAQEDSVLKVLYTGIGITKGMVIEGNLGSCFKKDYTVIGDVVNAASRLEALTRNLPRSLVFSEAVKNSTQKHWDFINLGCYKLKGKNQPIQVYSIDQEITRKCSNGTQVAREITEYLDIIMNFQQPGFL
ncbi:family 3 adenylate cyclase [Planktothricoides sp. SR001]|uniref:BLUF domain-containing protein n=1 Tax=Planktothricoides sp. SR001 TaxID=1705388 RepID=UPI0006BFDABA|nr:BLUF domain-containing protein [Planktothricoides sp. SR001]KOR36897.1 family 3 adenylate cyclase [Planktothricoides sp. SR001]